MSDAWGGAFGDAFGDAFDDSASGDCQVAFQIDAFQTDAFQTCVVPQTCHVAFQINAFQTDAFQTCVVPQTVTGTSGHYADWYKKAPLARVRVSVKEHRRDRLSARVNAALPAAIVSIRVTEAPDTLTGRLITFATATARVSIAERDNDSADLRVNTMWPNDEEEIMQAIQYLVASREHHGRY